MRIPLWVVLAATLATACDDPGADDDDDGDAPLLGEDGGDGGGGDGADGSDGTGGSDGGSGLEGSCDTGTAADLVFGVLVEDRGGPCSTCDADSLRISAAVYNPCPDPLGFRTRSTCLYTTLQMEGPYGEGMGMGVACGDAEIDWTVSGGGIVSEAIWSSSLESGEWLVIVQFDDFDRTSAEARFLVEGGGSTGSGSTGSGGSGGSSGGSSSGGGTDPEPSP